MQGWGFFQSHTVKTHFCVHLSVTNTLSNPRLVREQCLLHYSPVVQLITELHLIVRKRYISRVKSLFSMQHFLLYVCATKKSWLEWFLEWFMDGMNLGMNHGWNDTNVILVVTGKRTTRTIGYKYVRNKTMFLYWICLFLCAIRNWGCCSNPTLMDLCNHSCQSPIN